MRRTFPVRGRNRWLWIVMKTISKKKKSRFFTIYSLLNETLILGKII